MATRSVIDVQVNSEEFQRFYSLFTEYNAELGEMPKTWKGLGDAMG